MGTSARTPPRECAQNRKAWTAAPLDDPGAEVARRIVVAIDGARDGSSLRSVAASAGLSHSALLNIMGGTVYPRIDTVVRLERGLGVRLWPVDADHY